MGRAGLDLGVFTPHSVRAASTSAAIRTKILLNSILETAGWSQTNTFRKYYDKPLSKTSELSKIIKGK